MDNLLKERRKKLQDEIDRAQSLLNENLDKAKISDYITIGGASLPGIVKGVIDHPVESIKNIDSISRTVLPPNNAIRKLAKFMSILVRGFEIINK